MSRRGLLFLALGALAGCATPPALRGERWVPVVAEGWAVLNPRNPPETRERALAEAERRAVEKAVGVRVTAQTRVSQGIELDQQITGRTRGVLKRYEILQDATEGNFRKIKIKALVLVDEDGLRGDFPGSGARVAVIAASAGASPNSPLERSGLLGIRRGLVEKGFEIVGPEKSGRPGKTDYIVIVASIEVHPLASPFSGWHSSRAALSVELHEAGTDRLLAETSGEGAALDPVAESASRRAGEDAGFNAAAALIQNLNNGRR